MDPLNALVVLANFVIVPAVAYGSQLALGALGVTLLFAVLRFANMAHGDTMAFGTMVTIFATWGLQAAGVSIAPLPTALLALPVGIAVTAALLYATDHMVYRFYRRHKVPSVILLIVSTGVMFVMNGVTRFVIGVDEIRFADGAKFLINANEFKQSTGLAEGLAFKASQAQTIVTAAQATTTCMPECSIDSPSQRQRPAANSPKRALKSFSAGVVVPPAPATLALAISAISGLMTMNGALVNSASSTPNTTIAATMRRYLTIAAQMRRNSACTSLGGSGVSGVSVTPSC